MANLARCGEQEGVRRRGSWAHVETKVGRGYDGMCEGEEEGVGRRG